MFPSLLFYFGLKVSDIPIVTGSKSPQRRVCNPHNFIKPSDMTAPIMRIVHVPEIIGLVFRVGMNFSSLTPVVNEKSDKFQTVLVFFRKRCDEHDKDETKYLPHSVWTNSGMVIDGLVGQFHSKYEHTSACQEHDETNPHTYLIRELLEDFSVGIGAEQPREFLTCMRDQEFNLQEIDCLLAESILAGIPLVSIR
jgi:hypothetical protein